MTDLSRATPSAEALAMARNVVLYNGRPTTALFDENDRRVANALDEFAAAKLIAREQKIAELAAALQQVADMIAGCHDAARRARLPQMVLHVARAALAAFEEGR